MYPDLKFILGHAGTRIYRQEAIEACIIPNLYMDFSEYQGFGACNLIIFTSGCGMPLMPAAPRR